MRFWKVKYLSIAGGLLLVAGIILAGSANTFVKVEAEVLGTTDEIILETESKFKEEVSYREEAVEFGRKEAEDQEMELGEKKILQEGKAGVKRVETRIMFYEGEKYDEVTYEEIVEAPITEIVAVGSRRVIRELDTPQGLIRYLQKIEGVWATSYDSTCLGCSTTTATGMKQGYGVVAVDPKVIPLYTRVYVPGYGIGIAGDVGGGVKGKMIDLGYDSLMGQWKAQYVDVYILVE